MLLRNITITWEYFEKNVHVRGGHHIVQIISKYILDVASPVPSFTRSVLYKPFSKKRIKKFKSQVVIEESNRISHLGMLLSS
jgi:hypothetical protein